MLIRQRLNAGGTGYCRCWASSGEAIASAVIAASLGNFQLFHQILMDTEAVAADFDRPNHRIFGFP